MKPCMLGFLCSREIRVEIESWHFESWKGRLGDFCADLFERVYLLAAKYQPIR